MKTNTVISRVLASVAFVLVCGFSFASNNSPVFFHNDATQDGKVISREIYKQNKINGNLTPVKKTAYEYNDNKEIISETTYKWNYDNKKWEERSFTTFNRSQNGLSVEFAVWNKSEKTFMPLEKYVYVTGDQNNLLAHYTYKNSLKSNKWILQKKVESPVYQTIYADVH